MKTSEKLRIVDRISKVLESIEGSWEGDPLALSNDELQQAAAYLAVAIQAKVAPDLENIKEMKDVINAIHVLRGTK